MSRFLSALKRLPDNDSLLQDLCAGLVICAFVAALAYGLAGIAETGGAARVRP